MRDLDSANPLPIVKAKPPFLLLDPSPPPLVNWRSQVTAGHNSQKGGRGVMTAGGVWAGGCKVIMPLREQREEVNFCSSLGALFGKERNAHFSRKRGGVGGYIFLHSFSPSFAEQSSFHPRVCACGSGCENPSSAQEAGRKSGLQYYDRGGICQQCSHDTADGTILLRCQRSQALNVIHVRKRRRLQKS